MDRATPVAQGASAGTAGRPPYRFAQDIIGGVDSQTGHKGWHSRGYLPHLDDPERIQFLTFRLADSMPQNVLASWEDELKSMAPRARNVEFRHRAEHFLDRGIGSCALRDEANANIVEASLTYLADQRYRLYAWVIMPNHVHALIHPFEGFTLGKIISSWKRFTATRINNRLGVREQLWYDDYFDRYMRNEDHFWDTVSYIESNPVVAGLCSEVTQWPFSSARYDWNNEGSRILT